MTNKTEVKTIKTESKKDLLFLDDLDFSELQNLVNNKKKVYAKKGSTYSKLYELLNLDSKEDKKEIRKYVQNFLSSYSIDISNTIMSNAKNVKSLNKELESLFKNIKLNFNKDSKYKNVEFNQVFEHTNNMQDLVNNFNIQDFKAIRKFLK